MSSGRTNLRKGGMTKFGHTPKDVPVVGLEHLDSDEIWLRKWETNPAENTFCKAFRKGQILFGRRRAYQKKLSLAPCDGICSGDITVIAAKGTKIVPELLPFLLRTDKFFDYAIQGSAGSLSPRVKWAHLAAYEFDLPPIQKQRQLADLLWAANDLKEAYRKAIAATDEMLKAKFREMFGDDRIGGVTNNARRISAVATIVLGSTPKSDVSAYWNGGCKWVTPAELGDSTIELLETERHISKEGASSANLELLPVDTVLLSTRAPIGKTAIVKKPMYCNQGFKAFVCSDSINPYYLLYVLRLNKEYLQEIGTGSTFRELSKRTVENLMIPVPEKDKQDDFVKVLHISEATKASLKKSIADLDQVMKGLINE